MNFLHFMVAPHLSCSLALGTPGERVGVMGLQRVRFWPQLAANLPNAPGKFTITLNIGGES